MRDIAKDDYSDLKTFLKGYSLENVMGVPEVDAAAKLIHRMCYGLLMWKSKLPAGCAADEALYFNEMVSDVIQSVPLIVQGYYKAAAMLLRSAIENFYKFVLVRYLKGAVPKSTYDLMDAVKSSTLAGTQPLIATCLDTLRDVYSNLCNYVHTSGAAYASATQALGEFPGVDPVQLAKMSNDARRAISSVNVALCVLEPSTFRSFNYYFRLAILATMTKPQRAATYDAITP